MRTYYIFNILNKSYSCLIILINKRKDRMEHETTFNYWDRWIVYSNLPFLLAWLFHKIVIDVKNIQWILDIKKFEDQFRELCFVDYAVRYWWLGCSGFCQLNLDFLSRLWTFSNLLIKPNQQIKYFWLTYFMLNYNMI